MMTAVLPEQLEVGEELRTALRAASTEAVQAIEERFKGASWREVAPQYFAAQRAAGIAEMRTLLRVLGRSTPLAKGEAQDMLALAATLYLGDQPGDVTLQPLADDSIRVRTTDCPVFRRLLDEQPLHPQSGMTACGCYSRRAGWYAALGMNYWDEMEANLKWGDPCCCVRIHLA
jgi:hypothetical protein